MVEYTFPTSQELREIERDLLPVLTNSDPIFQFLPIKNVNEDTLSWEIRDNMTGLQAIRGLGGEPPTIAKLGHKRYIAEPGYFGERYRIDEHMLTRMRPVGQLTGKVDITSLVREGQDLLLNREINRIRQIAWTLVTTGEITITNARGNRLYYDAYNFQTAVAAVSWGTVATATPLADFRGIQLLGRGSSTSFDERSTAMMNRKTANKLLSNTNQNDLAGRRVTALLSPLNVEEINRILLGEGLPKISIYDDGYLNDSGTFVPFIPDDVVIVFGNRPGQSLGEYRMTRNASNPDNGPGSYVHVSDSLQSTNPVPRKIDIDRGHNGGPVVFYPLGIVVLDVS